MFLLLCQHVIILTSVTSKVYFGFTSSYRIYLWELWLMQNLMHLNIVIVTVVI